VLEEAGHLDAAAVAYRQALDGDPESVLAVHGARRVADRIQDRNAHAKQDGGAADAGFEPDRLVEVALLAQHLGQGGAEQDGAEEVNIEVDLAPEEPPSVETAPLSPDSLHELVELARRSGREEAAVCASSVLVALGAALLTGIALMLPG